MQRGGGGGGGEQSRRSTAEDTDSRNGDTALAVCSHANPRSPSLRSVRFVDVLTGALSVARRVTTEKAREQFG